MATAQRGTNKEFALFLHHAKGSAGEVRCILYAALDDESISEREFTQLTELATTVARRLSTFIKYLQGRSSSTPDNVTT